MAYKKLFIFFFLVISHISRANIPKHLVEIESVYQNRVENHDGSFWDIHAILSQGTGFVWKGNMVVTNHHLVDRARAENLKIKIKTEEGYISEDAQIYATSLYYDLAILKLDNTYPNAYYEYKPGCETYTIGFLQTVYRSTPLRTPTVNSHNEVDYAYISEEILNFNGGSGSPIYHRCSLWGVLHSSSKVEKKITGTAASVLDWMVSVNRDDASGLVHKCDWNPEILSPINRNKLCLQMDILSDSIQIMSDRMFLRTANSMDRRQKQISILRRINFLVDEHNRGKGKKGFRNEISDLLAQAL